MEIRLMQSLVKEIVESRGASGLMTGLMTIMRSHAWLCIHRRKQLGNIFQLEKDMKSKRKYMM